MTDQDKSNDTDQKSPEPPVSASMPRRILRRTGIGLIGLAIACGLVWSTMALRFSNLPIGDIGRQVLGGLVLLGFLIAFIIMPKRKRTTLVFAGWFIFMLGWYLLIPASHDRNWKPEVAKLPHGEINVDQITIHNIRNFDYSSETEFEIRYEDRTYDLSKLESMDYLVSDWGLGTIVHSMFSFGFSDGKQLCVSVETRPEIGEEYSTVRGFFRQFELIVILADENDLLGQRIWHRKENVYVYPIKSTPSELRRGFLHIIDVVNQVHAKPRWYNTLTDNCTLALMPDASERRITLDYRVLLNGDSPQMLYENGVIDTQLSFEEAKKKYHVNELAGDGPNEIHISKRIRPDRWGKQKRAENP